MSPEKVALAVALGATCGLFPVFGATTAVAAAAGVLFRANPVVVQIFNYAMYPVYFFVEFGLIATAAWIFEGDLHAYTPEGLRALFNAGWGAMLSQGGRALGQAVVLWLTLAPFTVLALRWLTLRIIDKWPARPRA
jgi:uncharacterized protein (DUF2062 family)